MQSPLLDHDSENPGKSKRPRLQFSLLALLAFTTVVCAALAWLNRPRPVEIGTRIQVDLPPSALFGNALHVGVRDFEIFRQMDHAHFDSLKNHQSHLAHFKNNAIMKAAINDPKCANLPIVAQQADPVAWLQDLLQVSDSGTLDLQISLPEDQAKQGVVLLQAVVDSYLQVADAAEKQQIKLELQSAKSERQQLLGKIKAAYQGIEERGPVYPWAEQFLEQLLLEGTKRDARQVLGLLGQFEKAIQAIANLREQGGQDDPQGLLLLEQAERDAVRVLELEIQVRYLEAYENELPHRRLIRGPNVLSPPIKIFGIPLTTEW